MLRYSKDIFKEFCNGANVLYFCHFEDNKGNKYKVCFNTLKDTKTFANRLLKVNKSKIIYIRQYHIDDVVGEYINNISEINMHSFLKHYDIKGETGYGC